jgi:hypothetical protein
MTWRRERHFCLSLQQKVAEAEAWSTTPETQDPKLNEKENDHESTDQHQSRFQPSARSPRQAVIRSRIRRSATGPPRLTSLWIGPAGIGLGHLPQPLLDTNVFVVGRTKKNQSRLIDSASVSRPLWWRAKCSEDAGQCRAR